MQNYSHSEIRTSLGFLLSLFVLVLVAVYSWSAAFVLSLIFNCLFILWLNGQSKALTKKLSQAQGELEKKKIDVSKDSQALQEKNKTLQDTERAVLNILEDTQELEMVLQQERDRLQAVLLSMTDGVLVISIEQSLVLANQSAMKMLELKETSIGKKVVDLFTIYHQKQPMPVPEWPNVQSLNTGKPLHFGIEAGFYIRTQTGTIFPISITTAPLKQEGRVWGIVAVIRDITVEKNLDEARSNFISTASHQLRTPLTSMRWFAEMLLTADAGKLSKDQKGLVEEILNSCTRMISLVAMLLQIARIEAGSMRLNPQVIDLVKITESIIQTFQGETAVKQQKIKFMQNSKSIPTVVMDQVIVWQVIQNLISNAIRYSPKNTTITVKMSLEPKFIDWSVTDQGIGIPKQQQPRIFEKFFRADNAVQFAPEGSGLGLPLVKNLVEEWGGKLSFDSVENKGTTFRMTIPLAGVFPLNSKVPASASIHDKLINQQ